VEWSSLIKDALLWRQAWRDEQVDHEATFPKALQFVNFIIGLIAAHGTAFPSV
jgi:hypothetical protein